jgi:hypothetical protein
VDRWRGLIINKQEIDDEQQRVQCRILAWYNKSKGVKARLAKAKVISCLHPYLFGERIINRPLTPDPQGLNAPYIPEMTIQTALATYGRDPELWYPPPWYANTNIPGHTPACLIQNPQCHYCCSYYHQPHSCLCPHSLCYDRESCLVPYNHISNGDGCPFLDHQITFDNNADKGYVGHENKEGDRES